MWNRRRAGGVLAAVLMLGSAAPVAAALPDPSEARLACAAGPDGELRLMQPAATCPPDETPIVLGQPVWYQGIGSGGPLAVGDWTDVPGAVVQIESSGATCAASFTGFLLHRGGTTRANARLLVRAQLDLPLQDMSFFVAQAPSPAGAVASMPFALQGLFVVPEGGATIVAQVSVADETWVMGDPSVLLVGC